jgi:hypothetical protein
VTDSPKEQTLIPRRMSGHPPKGGNTRQRQREGLERTCASAEHFVVKLGTGRDVVAEANWEPKAIVSDPRLPHLYVVTADQIDSKELLLQHNH